VGGSGKACCHLRDAGSSKDEEGAEVGQDKFKVLEASVVLAGSSLLGWWYLSGKVTSVPGSRSTGRNKGSARRGRVFELGKLISKDVVTEYRTFYKWKESKKKNLTILISLWKRCNEFQTYWKKEK